MAKLKPTTELLEGILARIPEGFIHRNRLGKRLKIASKDKIAPLLEESFVANTGNLYYDTRRLTEDQVMHSDTWCKPVLPTLHKDGGLPEKTIDEKQAIRDEKLTQAKNENYDRIMRLLGYTAGFTTQEALCSTPEERLALKSMLDDGWLKQMDDLIFDPLRVGQPTMQTIAHRHTIMPLHQALVQELQALPGHTIEQKILQEKYDKNTLTSILNMGGFSTYIVPMKVAPYQSTWIRLKESDPESARDVAAEAVSIKDADWEDALQHCGEVVRNGARDGTTNRIRVVARTYTVSKAAKLLNVHQESIERAIKDGVLSAFPDPEERTRIPAEDMETVYNDPELTEEITAYEIVKVRDLSLVAEMNYSTMRRRLVRLKINARAPRWGEVRGKWKLPNYFYEYRMILDAKRQAWEERKAEERADEQRKIREVLDAERKHRESLRARLVAAFPTWQHAERNDQHITLHIGPPNSGKTHDSLTVLSEAGSGWYLAPLRLLAFEVFDRLNRQGVLCNLLTGEEYIPVPGANITAATIEMFNPNTSGEVVVIDEAQLLADADRGWAWTRALMSAQSPDIHVIAPNTAQGLIEKLASEAAISLEVIEHQRLAPIEVSDTNWEIDNLPASTILVAFSRRMVLHLKTILEQQNRRVSVVYGGLPPEVRRKQADRFASGETEICVATDAVGMGLNLPADHVCFYEVEKYDGRDIRSLYPAEVQQIGGRAGRFGLSTVGKVGATSMRDLKMVRKLFYADATILTHARVAPSLQDLELLPGSLHERLLQWSELQSIPESLRNVIKTADLSERIELARMLRDEEVDKLGMEKALKLVNAPTRKETRAFWYNCTQHILKGFPMPTPPPPPNKISMSRDLEATEISIACADIYLWLSQRREFSTFGADRKAVSNERETWSLRIDFALINQLDTSRRCPECGKMLKINHRHRLCDNCFVRERMR
ncbi:MAG: helicase-related protein [Aggregatilineales bacterium]